MGRGFKALEAEPRMMMIDTTVWIDYLRGTPTPEERALETLILAGQRMICLTDIILTEILQGVRMDAQYTKARHFFERLPCLTAKAPGTFIHAAELYRYCRKKGVTVRSTVDCLIAAVCLENKIPLLHHDADFAHLSKLCGLKSIDPATVLKS